MVCLVNSPQTQHKVNDKVTDVADVHKLGDLKGDREGSKGNVMVRDEMLN